MEFAEKIKAVVIGHAVGDALGVPVEFASREELDKAPVTDMEGYGTYPVPAGAWSDDTSMSLCTLDVLGRYGLDYDGVMINFGKWYYNDEFTPTGEMFDVGNTCSIAIENYVVGKKSYSECGRSGERDNGNGSLMRIHPVVLYLVSKDMPMEEKIEIVHTMSALTHAHDRSKIGCGIYAFILWELLNNPTMSAIKDGLGKAARFYEGQAELVHYNRLFERTFIITPRNAIKSDGYIVNTLEAAVWCLLTTNSYHDAVLKAVNLGDDTDTVAAITGGLAGALYGYDAIPEKWGNTLMKREYIESLCEQII
jgi:ADP-ribosylglycohydrolase